MLSFRAPDPDVARWEMAAKLAGITLSEFLRRGADIHAQCVAFPQAAWHIPSADPGQVEPHFVPR